MATVQDCINLARIDLGDVTTNVFTGSAVTPRNSDADLLRRANAAIVNAYAIRPDLNYGNYGTAYTDLVATSSFPLPIQYREAIAAYIVAKTESGEDPLENNQRAALAMKRYMMELGL